MPASQFGYRNPATKRLRGPVNIKLAPILLPQLFGGVLTVTGMLGMIGIFAMNSPAAQKLANSVSLLVPQGWAVRGLLQSVNGQPLADVLLSMLVMLAWSAFFFAVGVWRFNRRYA